MNCPRCTQDIPEEASFCPHCGLDLGEVAHEPVGGADETPDFEFEAVADDAAAEGRGGLWPAFLSVHATRHPKRPFLAATLAFFFGPFTYLYLEQANWFWWGLLGGFGLIAVSRAEAIPILLIGYMLHAYDLAQLLNEEHEEPLALEIEPEEI